MVLVAAGQFCARSIIADNLIACKEIIRSAHAAGARAVFLPEASDFIAKNAEESKKLTCPIAKNELVQGLMSEASELKIAICVGIHEPGSSDRIRNSCLWIDEAGRIAENYSKLHLFDAELSTGQVLKESQWTEPGKKLLPPFDSMIGKIRFPELSIKLRKLGSDIISFPSAFTVRTGAAHWSLLNRARAVDSQCYVVSAAQVGKHNDKRESWGHAMIVDPYIDDKPRFCIADIDTKLLGPLRQNMPLLDQRRDDITF